MRLLVHFHIQVTGRASAGADLTLGGEADPHAVADTGGDLHADLAAGADPAVAHALVAGVGDHDPDTAAGRTGPRRHHLAEQGTLHGLHLTAAAAGVTRDRRGVAVGALALASITQHGGVDGDLLGHTGRALLQVEPHPQQRVRTRANPADRPAAR
jgi:hypothetical protein